MACKHENSTFSIPPSGSAFGSPAAPSLAPGIPLISSRPFSPKRAHRARRTESLAFLWRHLLISSTVLTEPPTWLFPCPKHDSNEASRALKAHRPRDPLAGKSAPQKSTVLLLIKTRAVPQESPALAPPALPPLPITSTRHRLPFQKTPPARLCSGRPVLLRVSQCFSSTTEPPQARLPCSYDLFLFTCSIFALQQPLHTPPADHPCASSTLPASRGGPWGDNNQDFPPFQATACGSCPPNPASASTANCKRERRLGLPLLSPFQNRKRWSPMARHCSCPGKNGSPNTALPRTVRGRSAAPRGHATDQPPPERPMSELLEDCPPDIMTAQPSPKTPAASGFQE
jgi:hypothetical protein